MKCIQTFVLILIGTIHSFAQNYSATEIPENLKKNANAVIRVDEEVYTVNSINDMEIQKKFAVTILNKSGDDYSAIMIPYNPTTKVSNIKVNIYDLFGKLMKTYSKKDFADYTNNRSGSLYVDERVLALKSNSTMFPFTVETIYETKTSNTIYLNSFMPFNSFGTSSQKASLKIINNSGIKIRSKITDNNFGKVKVSESGNTTEYSYQEIPAIKEENLSPSIDYLKPRVDFSPEKFSLAGKQGDLTNWENFGKWYFSQLIKPSSEITPQISQEINALNLSGSTEDKVKKIYQYMQNKTRYVLISMGIGGWQPMSADEVAKKGYGDCKGLTNYMKTLLDAAGIKSYFAVIYDGRTEQRYDKNFPELSGNHAILVVPTEKGNIWLENTNPMTAFNHLSFTSHNRNVLAVKENGIELIDTPVYQPEESKEILNAEIQINPDGSINAISKFLYSGGQYDYNLALFGMKDDDLKNYFKTGYYSLKIKEVSIQDLQNDRDNAEISFLLKLNASDYSKKLGNDLFFPVIPFGKSSLITQENERALPFETSFPYQDDYSIAYTVPSGFKFSEIPTSVNFSSEFGTYSLEFEEKEGKLLVHRKLTMKRGIYPKEKFNDYVEFRKKIASNDNTKILITL